MIYKTMWHSITKEKRFLLSPLFFNPFFMQGGLERFILMGVFKHSDSSLVV